jgi:hypothetical protein
VDVEPLVVRGESVLLARFALAVDAIGETLLAAARGEVLGRRDEHRARGVAWGYLLGLEREATAAAFPAAWELCDRLAAVAARVAPHAGNGFRFSFCKGYAGPVIAEAAGVHHEGLHIDTHPEVAAGTDLLRVLLNVDTSARRFRYGDATRVELARAGLHADRARFEADHVAAHVPLHDVCIPGRRGTRLSGLLFWASVLPHVGITEAPGYFLYSFEAVAPTPCDLDAAARPLPRPSAGCAGAG